MIIDSDSPPATTTDIIDYDLCLNTATNKTYQFKNGQWNEINYTPGIPQAITNITQSDNNSQIVISTINGQEYSITLPSVKGDQGEMGVEGPQGEIGPRGSLIFCGVDIIHNSNEPEVPSSSKTESVKAQDLYININTGNFYQAVEDGIFNEIGWAKIGRLNPIVVNGSSNEGGIITGIECSNLDSGEKQLTFNLSNGDSYSFNWLGDVPGPKGEQGPQGDPGATWLTGELVSTIGTSNLIVPEARKNDFYLNVTTGDIFRCVQVNDDDTSNWVKTSTIQLKPNMDYIKPLKYDNKKAWVPKSLAIGGTESISQEQADNSLAIGVGQRVLSLNSVASGAENEITSQGLNGAAIGGRENKVTAEGAITIGGRGLKATSPNQVVLGQYNVMDSDQSFIIGSGTVQSPSNCFTISKYGTMLCPRANIPNIVSDNLQVNMLNSENEEISIQNKVKIETAYIRNELDISDATLKIGKNNEYKNLNEKSIIIGNNNILGNLEEEDEENLFFNLTVGDNNILSTSLRNIVMGFENELEKSLNCFITGERNKIINQTLTNDSSTLLNKIQDSVIIGGYDNNIKYLDRQSSDMTRGVVIAGSLNCDISSSSEDMQTSGIYSSSISSIYDTNESFIFGGRSNWITSKKGSYLGIINSLYTQIRDEDETNFGSSKITILGGDSNDIKGLSYDSLLLGCQGEKINEIRNSILIGTSKENDADYISYEDKIILGKDTLIQKKLTSIGDVTINGGLSVQNDLSIEGMLNVSGEIISKAKSTFPSLTTNKIDFNKVTSSTRTDYGSISGSNGIKWTWVDLNKNSGLDSQNVYLNGEKILLEGDIANNFTNYPLLYNELTSGHIDLKHQMIYKLSGETANDADHWKQDHISINANYISLTTEPLATGGIVDTDNHFFTEYRTSLSKDKLKIFCEYIDHNTDYINDNSINSSKTEISPFKISITKYSIADFKGIDVNSTITPNYISTSLVSTNKIGDDSLISYNGEYFIGKYNENEEDLISYLKANQVITESGTRGQITTFLHLGDGKNNSNRNTIFNVTSNGDIVCKGDIFFNATGSVGEAAPTLIKLSDTITELKNKIVELEEKLKGLEG